MACFTYLFICYVHFCVIIGIEQMRLLRDSRKVTEFFFLLQLLQQTHIKDRLFSVPR